MSDGTQQPITWAALQARQRDALVAERIMGWKQHPPSCPHGPECTTCVVWESPQGDLYLLTDEDGLPPYTTSMDAAWLIVEKMKQADTIVALSDELEKLLRVKSLFNILWYITPEAICLAALRAVGCEVDTNE